MSVRRRAEFALWVVLALAAIALGTLAALEDVGTDWRLYAKLQREAGVLETAGISEEDLLRVDLALASCLKGNADAFYADEEEGSARKVLQVTVDGQPRDAFNSRELTHMEDCRKLFELLRRVIVGLKIGMAALAAVLAIGFLRFKDRRLTGRQVCRAAGLAPLLLLVPLGAFAIWAVCDFNAAFNFFHRLLFTNDLWLLDPRTDLLIRICPQSMFAAMGRMIGLRALAWMAGVPVTAVVVWLGGGLKESFA